MIGTSECPVLCPTDYKDFLVWELSIDEKQHTEILQDTVGFFWSLSESQSQGNPELQFLYTKLEMLKTLMGCYYNDHDYTQGKSHSLERSESKRQENSQAGSQGSQHSYSESDSASTSEYNDRAVGVMKAFAKRIAHSESHDLAKSHSKDVGKGEGTSTACSDETSDATSKSLNTSASKGASKSDGGRRGREYEYNRSDTAGKGLVPLITEWSITTGTSQWDKDMYNRAKTNSAETRKGSSLRSNVSANRSNRDGRRNSFSFFQADVLSCSEGTSTMESCEESRSSRDAYAKSTGEGYSKARFDSRSEVGSQGTAQSHNDHEFHSQGNGFKSNVFDVIKASQRFANIKTLYDKTWQMIKLIRELVKNSSSSYIVSRLNKPAENCKYQFLTDLYCKRCCNVGNSCGCSSAYGGFYYARAGE